MGEPGVSESGDTAVTAVPTTGPADRETSATIERVGKVIPGNAYVTGITVVTDDFNAQLSRTLPWFIGAVVGVPLLLLMIVFRSIAVPWGYVWWTYVVEPGEAWR